MTQALTPGRFRYTPYTPPDCHSAQGEPHNNTDAASKMRRNHVPDGPRRREVTDRAFDAPDRYSYPDSYRPDSYYPAAGNNYRDNNYARADHYFAYPSTAPPSSTYTAPPPRHEQPYQPQYAGRAAQEAFAGGGGAYAGAPSTGYHSGYGYGDGQQYGYPAYAPVQYSQPQQQPAWNGWQPINADWRHLRAPAPAQQEGFTYRDPAYPDQWYAQAHATPAAQPQWGALHYAPDYQPHQQLLTPYQDEQSAEAKPAPEPIIKASVIVDFVAKRIGADKNIRNKAAPTTKKSRRQMKLEKNAKERVAALRGEQQQQQLPPREPLPQSPKVRRQMLQRPTPDPTYLANANKQPESLDSPRPLLVILDLNGTLLFRRNSGRNNVFTARPHVQAFLDFLFSNHIVMVWSSARPENVRKMCSDLFTKEQKAQIVAVWARDKLRLTPAAYNERVQVYKQLSWVWEDASIQGKTAWSQANTVLIDDSLEKAASEPFNLIQIDDFEGKPEQMKEDVLGQVIQYLGLLSTQRDVSSFIRSQPFQIAPVASAAQ